nr:transposase [Okeania sp. SIO2C2]
MCQLKHSGVIERTNSWMERCKSLTKNFVCAAFRRKRTLNNATVKINLCFIRLMLKRLTSHIYHSGVLYTLQCYQT